jgi:hypothetical protein
MKKTYVVAGNCREFEEWCHEKMVSKHSPLVQYIPEFQAEVILVGTKNPDVICYGTYNDRKDIVEVNNVIRNRCRPEIKIVYVEVEPKKEKVDFAPMEVLRKVLWVTP